MFGHELPSTPFSVAAHFLLSPVCDLCLHIFQVRRIRFVVVARRNGDCCDLDAWLDAIDVVVVVGSVIVVKLPALLPFPILRRFYIHYTFGHFKQ